MPNMFREYLSIEFLWALLIMKRVTREEWLERAVKAVTPIFTNKGFDIPPCRVSCGFASTGVRSGHIGQCWSTKASQDGINQIFISPALSEGFEVVDTLVHELVHAVDDCANKHGKEFKKIALSVGLVGPMRSAGAGEKLKPVLMEIAAKLGEYPHSRLKISKRIATKQSRPRAMCSQCEFTVPMLKKYLHYGPPLCPQHKIEMVAIGDWDE